MVNAAVARRYAKALLGAVLETEGNPETVAGELEGLAAAIAQFNGLELLLLNPAVETEKKAAVLIDVAQQLGASEVTRRFVGVLAERERLEHLRAAAAEYRVLVDAHLGILNAEVTSPTALGEHAVADLRDKLVRATGRKVRLSTKTDPELLGGLVTRIGDLVYDGSLRYQLERMRDQMMDG